MNTGLWQHSISHSLKLSESCMEVVHQSKNCTLVEKFKLKKVVLCSKTSQLSMVASHITFHS